VTFFLQKSTGEGKKDPPSVGGFNSGFRRQRRLQEEKKRRGLVSLKRF